jgi:nitroreductase
MKKPGAMTFIRSLWRIVTRKPQTPPTLQDHALLHTILRRRSIRRFTGRAIPDDVFAAILEAGRVAPSTVNLQTWAFATFTPATWRETFGGGLPFKGSRAVVVMGDTHRDRLVLDLFPHSPLVEYTIAVMNASLAAMNMNIAAEALGVSSVMLSDTGRSGLLDAGYLKRALSLPDGVFPLMTIVFGYAAGAYPPMPPRLALDQVCFPGAYREADRTDLEDWAAQLQAGYKAMRPFSSFERQVEHYRSKIGGAEADLREMIFHREEEPS